MTNHSAQPSIEQFSEPITWPGEVVKGDELRALPVDHPIREELGRALREIARIETLGPEDDYLIR